MFLKALQKVDAGLIPDKRKRDDLVNAILTDSIMAIEMRYQTPISVDHQTLQQDISQRHRMAVLVRLGEKRLLQEAKTCLRAAADGMSDGPSESSKRTKRTI